MVLKTSDYLTVLESFNDSDIAEIYAEIERELKQYTLDEVLEHLYQSVPRVTSSVTDAYSLLRYCLFLLRKSRVPRRIDIPATIEIHDMGEATRQWARNLLFLRGGGNRTDFLGRSRTIIDHYLAFISIFETYPADIDTAVLDLAGSSLYIDSLIAQQLRAVYSSRDTHDFGDSLFNKLEAALNNGVPKRFLFDLFAEHKLDVLTEAELSGLLDDHNLDTATYCALLRYIGELGKTVLLSTLHELVQQPGLELSILYTLIDVIAQLGDSSSISVLNNLNTSGSSTISEFTRTSIRELEVGKKEAKSDTSRGVTLVQCAFYGDLTHQGVSMGGGLGTFLHELGDYLAGNEEIEEVYTFTLLSIDKVNSDPLLEELRDGHKLIRIPTSFDLSDEAFAFLQNEYEIMRTIKRTLERYDIDPDIFHIRYTDNASKAVLILAKNLGKKVVFTLTPDPHKTFIEDGENFRTVVESKLLHNLNKVFIADLLINHIDGLLLIGFEGKNSQVLPYFPQLLFDKTIRNKPLAIVAEGVCPDLPKIGRDDATTFPDLLTSHDGNYQLSQSFLDRPVILNVGSLGPLKGQHNLVEAWIESSLNQTYNLVLVGGNLADPSPEEASVVKRIEDLMESRPELRGRFCHVPAIQNSRVRLLEHSIMKNIHTDLPNVYVCSSFKEEFGISILEGMVAGFLICAPMRGGASDYIEHGINGFLIQTDDAESIRTDIEAVLQHYEGKESLHEIALQGQQFAKNRLDIGSIGRDYLDYYAEILQQE